MFKTITAALVSGLLLSTSAHGALLLQENFDALANGDLNGQNGWTADPALDIASGGLSYTNGSVSIAGGAKHATWSGANVQPLGSKTFASQSGEVWFSLTINVTATNTSSRFWFYVSDDPDLGNAGVMGQINTGSNALLAGYRATSTQYTSSNATLPTNQTLFLVGRFSQAGVSPAIGDYDKMEMWVNPSSATLGTGSNYYVAADTTGSGISTGIDTFAVTALGTGSTVLWDNLRVGTTQADVLDVYVPEPTALAGLTAVAMGLLRRRRA